MITYDSTVESNPPSWKRTISHSLCQPKLDVSYKQSSSRLLKAQESDSVRIINRLTAQRIYSLYQEEETSNGRDRLFLMPMGWYLQDFLGGTVHLPKNNEPQQKVSRCLQDAYLLLTSLSNVVTRE